MLLTVFVAILIGVGFILINRMEALERYVLDGGVGCLLFLVVICVGIVMRLALVRERLSSNMKLVYSVLLMALAVVGLPFFGFVESRLELAKGHTGTGFYVSMYMLVKYGYSAISLAVIAIAAGVFSGIVTSSNAGSQ
ncbi:MAG: hypothetical protein ACN6OU_05425 [Stenotrophomonas acidaminiphila]